jgi:D-xylose transport system substrate-binding protein
MKKTSLISVVAVAAVSMLALAGCSSTPTATATAAQRACVILPDADSGTRWESGDRPALDKALTAAGYTTDIQNAQKDANKYATIADAQLAKGCGVMLLVDFQGAAVTVAAKAKKAGVPVIAYDRPIDGADYYVSFDNTVVGRHHSKVGGDQAGSGCVVENGLYNLGLLHNTGWAAVLQGNHLGVIGGIVLG